MSTANRKIQEYANLVTELLHLDAGLREAGKHLNMSAWYDAEREALTERAWQEPRRWHWMESREAQRVESEDQERVARKWPLVGQVVAEGVVAGMEALDGDFV